jgi:hypothetical protein
MVVLTAVKVFTFRDLPWTQVFAAVYFAAFVVQEVVNHIGPPKQTLTLPVAAVPGSVPPEVDPIKTTVAKPYHCWEIVGFDAKASSTIHALVK